MRSSPPVRPDPFHAPRRWSRTALPASVALHVLFILAWVYGPRPAPHASDRALLRPPPAEAPIVIELPGYRERVARRAPSAPDDAARPQGPGGRPPGARGLDRGTTSVRSLSGVPGRAATRTAADRDPTAADTQAVIAAIESVRGDSGAAALAGRIAPQYATGRLWQRALPLPPKDIAERMTGRGRQELIDSVVRVAVDRYLDSLAKDPMARPATTPSWTTEVAGRKFGIDGKWIYVAGLKIPTAVLALLPLPQGGSLDKQKAWQHAMDLRRDIEQSAQRAANSEDVKQAIKDIRRRKEEEEEFRRNQRTPPEPPAPATAATPQGDPPTP